jgi:hypothetical protein
MRELVYKSISGSNPRKCEVSIEEVSDPIDTTRSKKWICKYYVRDKHTAKDLKGLKDWIHLNKEGCKKNCHILRKYNADTGENTLMCKILGEFFVVRELTAYKVLYVNEIKIQCRVTSARA